MFTNRFFEISIVFRFGIFFSVFAVFSQRLQIFENGCELKDRLLPCVSVYSSVLFLLDFSVYSLLWRLFDISKTTLSNLILFDQFSKNILLYQSFGSSSSWVQFRLRKAHLFMRTRPRKLMALGKVSFDFLTVFFFLQFLTFLENYPPKSEILGSI